MTIISFKRKLETGKKNRCKSKLSDRLRLKVIRIKPVVVRVVLILLIEDKGNIHISPNK